MEVAQLQLIDITRTKSMLTSDSQNTPCERVYPLSCVYIIHTDTLLISYDYHLLSIASVQIAHIQIVS